MTRELSDAKREAMQSLITDTVETGAISYWAHGFRYVRSESKPLSEYANVDAYLATITALSFVEDESGKRFTITLAQLHAAMNRIVRDHTLTGALIRTYIVSDDIDALAADAIAQVAAFGELVYG